MLVPPNTDAGLLSNLKFSFSDTFMKLNHGGWSRQITVRELPIATSLAGVNMSLTAGGVRELHQHKQAEWSYMLLGRARISSVDQKGRNFIADIGPGDIWYFPLVSHIRFKGWNIVNFCWSSIRRFFRSFHLIHFGFVCSYSKRCSVGQFRSARKCFQLHPSEQVYIYQGEVPVRRNGLLLNTRIFLTSKKWVDKSRVH